MKPHEGSHLSCERGSYTGVIVVCGLKIIVVEGLCCLLLKVPDEN